MDWVVAGRFEIKYKLGSGTYGEIYLGNDLETSREVALKFERAPSQNPQLHIESQAYTHLAGGIGIPGVIWIGFERSYAILVIERLGRSLEDLLHVRRRPFSLKTTLMIVDQSLRRIEFVHRKGIVHRDIKPSNMLMDVDQRCLYFIDFGLSKAFIDADTGQHIPAQRYPDMIGTPRFASHHAMRGFEPSRRDDLISLGYVWVYLFKGALPWQSVVQGVGEGEIAQIRHIKTGTSPEDLCSGMPTEFRQYFEALMRLHFQDEPPYAALRESFRDLFVQRGYCYDCRFDWMQPPPCEPSPFIRRLSLQTVLVRPQDRRGALPQPQVIQPSVSAGAVPELERLTPPGARQPRPVETQRRPAVVRLGVPVKMLANQAGRRLSWSNTIPAPDCRGDDPDG
jgi:serine/threonine protein kinase